MQYLNLLDLLRAVRDYELQKGEGLAPSNSVRGTEVGYCTTDSQGPSTRWLIGIDALRASCEGSKEAQEIYRRMRFFQDRRMLLEDLRAGKVQLDTPDPPPKEPEVQEEPEPPVEEEPESTVEENPQLQDFIDMFDI